jgi:hypothetical protein
MLQASGLKFSVIFLRAIANAEMLPKFLVVLHASRVDFPMATSTSESNATLPTSDTN